MVTDGKLMFKTEFGSEYSLLDSGLWVRNKFDGTVYKDFIYLGSVNTSVNPSFLRDGSDLNKIELQMQMDDGVFAGFVPNYVVGYVPFGIKKEDFRGKCGDEDIVISRGRYNPQDVYPKISDEFIDPSLFRDRPFSKHIGHKITWVSPQLEEFLLQVRAWQKS